MPPTDVTSKPPAGDSNEDFGDELDDIFDYDVDAPISNFAAEPAKETTSSSNKRKSGAGLGIDEEVEVAKKARRPRVKLDEDRLLSADGIPKLRQRAKHLKFKGKGHEYSDVTRLLSFYQLWLDDLFPRARFLDAAAMVEKLGHKKRIQIMRMEWINEGKPHNVHEDSLFDEPELPIRENAEREKTASRVAPIFEKRASERPTTPVPNADVEMEDLYNATPRAAGSKPATATAEGDSQDSIFGGGTQTMFGPSKTTSGEVPDDDELDALFAEESELQRQDPEEDDLDMLLAEDAAISKPKPAKAVPKSVEENDSDDDDALLQLLAEQANSSKEKGALARREAVSEKAMEDDIDEDEEEALRAMEGN